jgi:hypothetical protein
VNTEEKGVSDLSTAFLADEYATDECFPNEHERF